MLTNIRQPREDNQCILLYKLSALLYIQLIDLVKIQSGPPEFTLGNTYDDSVLPKYRRVQRQSELYYVSWYIRTGHAEIKSPDGVLFASEGQWVLFDPLCEHSHIIADDAILVSIRFRIFWRGLNYLPPLSPIRVVDGADKPAMLIAAEALCQANKKDPPPASPGYFEREAKFNLWLEQWRRERESLGSAPDTPTDPRVYAIMQCLSENLSIEPIDYEALRKAVGLSRAQINRVFHKSVGVSPRQWLVARCLDEAQRQIRAGEMSLKEIAALLGFFDASHFTRWHRRQTGQSPTDWKLQAF